ncbi:MAG: hypothetical protein C4287_19585, partial [Leptolyngbya sp. ERB_1_2]
MITLITDKNQSLLYASAARGIFGIDLGFFRSGFLEHVIVNVEFGSISVCYTKLNSVQGRYCFSNEGIA